MGFLPGRLVSHCRAADLPQTLDGFFLAELIAVILVLSGAYRVLDAWIARVSREERALLEARQAAILAAEKEEKGDESHVSQ